MKRVKSGFKLNDLTAIQMRSIKWAWVLCFSFFIPIYSSSLTITYVNPNVLSVSTANVNNAGNNSLTVTMAPTVLAQRNFLAGLSSRATFVTRNIIVAQHTVIDSSGTPVSSIDGDGSGSQDRSLALAPLFYPSPAKITDESHLYLKFSNGDSTGEIELRIYDMRGNEIYRAYKQKLSHNVRFRFTNEELGHSNMPAGVYFFLVLYDGQVLVNADGAIAGKGKFAILP